MNKTAINKRFVDSVIYIIQKDKSINKTVIAESLGISKSKFSEILNFRMSVGVDIIAQFCTIYNIDANWMLTGKDSILKENKFYTSESEATTIASESEKPGHHRDNADYSNLEAASKEELIIMIKQLIEVNNRNSISIEKMVDTADRNSISLSRLVDILYNEAGIKGGSPEMEANAG